MSQPFALTVRAPKTQGYDLADTLGFDEITEALAVSIFDDGEDSVSVQALYEDEKTAHQAQSRIDAHFESVVAQLPNEDWVGLSQSGLPPIKTGRFFIHGSHDTLTHDIQFPILVDAGEAFGTGHHGTTKGCLLMLDSLETSGVKPANILDLGTGAGILAIAAAQLFPKANILATDIDPIAVSVAETNARRNGVKYNTVTADGFNSPALKDRTFDLVIANILAGPLRGLASDIARSMSNDGYAILSGILDEQADWVADAFSKHKLNIQVQPSLSGWTSLLAIKR